MGAERGRGVTVAQKPSKLLEWVRVPSPAKPILVAMDLEGCLLPEIWLYVAKQSGVKKFQLTTRDIKSYDQLMRLRIQAARENGITLAKIQQWISALQPLAGARSFLDWLRARAPLLILSDTFYEFSLSLMPKLGWPTLLCHTLSVSAADGYIFDYHLRAPQSKAGVVRAMQKNGFTVIAIGDSYNDIGMLKKAERAFLLHAPVNIRREYPQFTACANYAELQNKLAPLLRVS